MIERFFDVGSQTLRGIPEEIEAAVNGMVSPYAETAWAAYSMARAEPTGRGWAGHEATMDRVIVELVEAS